MLKFLTKVKQCVNTIELLKEQIRFVLDEIERINKESRYRLLGGVDHLKEDMLKTKSSFDYQWQEIPSGIAMPDDNKYMEKIESLICKMTDLPEEWFNGKQVVDIGCGVGRFTYGFLSLNAIVTACDQSPSALERTKEFCQKFGDRLSTRQINLLEWDERGGYDLAFCFGVVHHTGNSYLAIRNASRKVKQGGRLFLMVYGFPETLNDFREVNAYKALRHELRNLSFEEKKQVLTKRFGPVLAHGWFDAISPALNDLLTFEEISELLMKFGFKNIKRTIQNRNHHIVADKV